MPVRSLSRAGLAAMVLVAGACGSGATDEGSVSADTVTTTTAVTAKGAPAEPSTAAAGTEGAAFLSFSVPAVGGGQVDAVKYQGRPTLLWFWSPW